MASSTPSPAEDRGEERRRADPAEMLRDNWVTAYEDLTVPFHRFERDYNVALGFDESWSPWEMHHRPIALQRLGSRA